MEKFLSRLRGDSQRQKWRRYLFGLNIALEIWGITLCALGGAVNRSETFNVLLSSSLSTGIIFVGVIVIIIALLGLVDAYIDHTWINVSYMAVLTLMCLIQLIVALLVVSDAHNADGIISNAWLSANNATLLQIEYDFSCCGLVTYKDKYAAFPCPTTAVPRDCVTGLIASLQQRYWAAGYVGIAVWVWMVSSLCVSRPVLIRVLMTCRVKEERLSFQIVCLTTSIRTACLPRQEVQLPKRTEAGHSGNLADADQQEEHEDRYGQQSEAEMAARSSSADADETR